MKLVVHSQTSTVEVWEWISNSIPHLTGRVITYQCYLAPGSQPIMDLHRDFHDILIHITLNLVSGDKLGQYLVLKKLKYIRGFN